MDVTGEAFDYRFVIVYDLRLGTVEGGDELGDVVDFGLVVDAGTDFL